jgi:two-component system phosphate regulon sensor histidine kinase PhoR
VWQPWTFALLRLVVALAAGAAIGLVIGRPVLGITLVLGGMLAWQYANLFRLERWLRHRSHEDPPNLRGVWRDVVGLVHRIYRRKQVHKRRVTQQFRDFRRLSEALPDGAVLLSGQREILWFNRKAAGLLGLRRKLDVGLPIANLIRDPAFVASLEKPEGGEGVVIRRQGTQRWLALFVVPAGGEYLMLARDVSREVRLEDLRRDFVANASHELRSPLTVISGYVDVLAEDGALPVEWREPVADMRRQAGRMRDIVEDLLELSSLEASDDEAPVEAVDIPSLLGRVLGEAGAEGAGIRCRLEAEPGLFLRGSESELHSIASNLVSNAVKYTPAGGSVTVRWSRDAAGASLAVQDTGVGIAAEHLPRLTERFYRVDRARSRAKGGSGLGLSIVKHALQRHGGRLAIESEEGRGSTFTAHFPARRVTTRTSAEIKAS